MQTHRHRQRNNTHLTSNGKKAEEWLLRPQLPAKEMAEVVHVCVPVIVCCTEMVCSIMHRPQTKFCAKPHAGDHAVC